ncbi:MAG: DUF3047 domain-containing protein [Rhodobacteraceae bacterium]|nr:DUF3047 domain-containing protein [Paracoccaceae bacterium]
MPCCLSAAHLNRREILGGAAAAGIAALATPKAALSALFPDGTFTTEVQSLFDTAGGASLGQLVPFVITGKTLPWEIQLADVKAGQSVTFLLSGRWHLLRDLDLWFEPGLVFHARTPGAAMYSPMGNAGTMVVTRDGQLELARAAGEWANAEGEVWTPLDAYQAADGRIEGAAIIWSGDPLEGITRLAEAGDVGGLVAQAKRRLILPEVTPEGWQNHYSFGEAGIFQTCGDEMCCTTHKNVSILQKNVDHALSDDLRLDWRWLVEELPSEAAENQIPTHDYLSIGVEFDDGQDITYFWSAELEPGLVFRCPIPGWDAIETHVVQRSGRAGLGEWFSESRNITEDYREIIGGPATRVNRIWLLGVSVFQRRMGSCRYADVSLGGAADVDRQVII